MGAAIPGDHIVSRVCCVRLRIHGKHARFLFHKSDNIVCNKSVTKIRNENKVIFWKLLIEVFKYFSFAGTVDIILVEIIDLK